MTMQQALIAEPMPDRAPAPSPLQALPPACPRRGPFTAGDLEVVEGAPLCELLDGHLLTMALPTVVHRAICAEILRRLTAWAGRCSAVVLGREPFAVALAPDSVVRPDAAVALRSRRDRAPELLIEVLDVGDARREREIKTRLYAEAGVREYWIVDPGARTIDFLVLHGGRYALCIPEDGVHRARSLPGLVFDVADLWWDAEQLVPLAL